MTTIEIRHLMTEALRCGHHSTVSVLRSVLAAIAEAETSGKTRRELSHDEILGVVRSEIKKRTEAASIYKEAGYIERAGLEEGEAIVLESLLPAQVGDEELSVAAHKAVQELARQGVTGKPALGKAIAAVKTGFGQSADPGRIASAVKAAMEP